ncbi:MAG: hypothetical protein HY801_10285 [Candidatus Lindowbacteria bacterium]|nr:hypothetical protein [Candidatus Lindowbacteria bacterium]
MRARGGRLRIADCGLRIGKRENFISWCTKLAVIILVSGMSRLAYCEETAGTEAAPERVCPLGGLAQKWEDWPQSQNFKITLEYRNYTYFEDESRGDSRDSINEGRLRIEYDNCFRDNMRVYVSALLQDDDDDFTHGFVDDFEDDDVKRNYFNFTEAFLDIYFETSDLRLGKQIINWGKADVFNPTDNITPTDYSNLLDDEDIGVVAVNYNYYWMDWNLQLVGVPGFTPTRLPPEGARFSLVPPDPSLPVEDPDLPPNTIENSQVGARLKTTYRGWDFSASYYDGVNDIPSPTLSYGEMFIPFPPFILSVPTSIVPAFNRFRAFGGDFATTFDKWGLHGEAAQFIFDGDTQDSYFQYVLGFDYTKSDIIFDHDLFIIVEYIGLDVTDHGNDLDTGTPLDKVLMSALATNIKYEFTEYTRLEIRGILDFYQGEDYYVQPELIHELTDNFEIALGLDILGGPESTFFGQFEDGDRVYAKLKYTF